MQLMLCCARSSFGPIPDRSRIVGEQYAPEVFVSPCSGMNADAPTCGLNNLLASLHDLTLARSVDGCNTRRHQFPVDLFKDDIVNHCTRHSIDPILMPFQESRTE